MGRSTWAERKLARIVRFYSERYMVGQRKCGACNGSGHYDHDDSPTCGACEGTGREPYDRITEVPMSGGSDPLWYARYVAWHAQRAVILRTEQRWVYFAALRARAATPAEQRIPNYVHPFDRVRRPQC